MTRLLVGPFNRVEGDLEVHLEVAGGRVEAAWVNASLYRGFERILEGRPVADALAITPRICGICSVAQSAAAAQAMAQLGGVVPAANGRLVADVIRACENVADHLTHFYVFFMPDFAREIYRSEPWHEAIFAAFRSGSGTATARFLEARAKLLHVLGIAAGKWPHSLALQPGGSTLALTTSNKVQLLTVLGQFRRFVETQVFGDALEAFLALRDAEQLRNWAAERSADLPCFLRIAEALSLHQLGRGYDRFLSYGAYGPPEQPLFAAGVWAEGTCSPVTPEDIVEDTSHAWLAGQPLPPQQGLTRPNLDRPEAYSWCKAPRLAGHVMEVGALARQVVDGQPLLSQLVAAHGGNVRERVLARFVEVARLLPVMEDWVRQLRPGEPFCRIGEPAHRGSGQGLVEAARGSLGHWLTAEGGRIQRYQIIAPTTWNFSPRDGHGRPGAAEKALKGTPVRPGETTPVAIQHVVRSFDPCMVCTVH